MNKTLMFFLLNNRNKVIRNFQLFTREPHINIQTRCNYQRLQFNNLCTQIESVQEWKNSIQENLIKAYICIHTHTHM